METAAKATAKPPARRGNSPDPMRGMSAPELGPVPVGARKMSMQARPIGNAPPGRWIGLRGQGCGFSNK